MARTRVPNKMKELTGNPGKRPYVKGELSPAGTLTPPPNLTKAAKVIWSRVVMAMPKGVYAATDQTALAVYCEQVAIYEAAVKHLDKEGLVSIGSQQQQIVSPYVRIMNEASRLIVTLGAKLFLDPASRQTINAPSDSSNDEWKPDAAAPPDPNEAPKH